MRLPSRRPCGNDDSPNGRTLARTLVASSWAVLVVALGVATPASAATAGCNQVLVRRALDQHLIPDIVGCRFDVISDVLGLGPLTVTTPSGLAPRPGDTITAQTRQPGTPIGNQPRMPVEVSTGQTEPTPTKSAGPADVRLTLLTSDAPTGEPGKPLFYRLVVANIGSLPASDVQVNAQPTNFIVTDIHLSVGSCSAFPCAIGTLAPHAEVRINVTGRASAAKEYVLDVTTRPATTKQEAVGNRVVIRGVATSAAQTPPTADAAGSTPPAVDDPPATSWHTAWQQGIAAIRSVVRGIGGVVIVAALVLPAFCGAVAAAVHRARARRRWTSMLHIGAALDGQASASVSALPMALPPLRVEVHIEPGTAHANSPLPIRLQEESA